MREWHIRRGSAILTFSICALLCGCGAFKKAAPLEETLRGAVVNRDGAPVSSAELLESTYILLYFSAHWCPPCQAFTPKLVEFYQTNGGGRRFNVILISGDRSEDDMFSYMKETHMPWPAVKYRSENARQLDKSYSGDGIPRLVLVDSSGSVLADSFEGRNYLGPETVLEKLKELLAKNNDESAASSTIIHPTPEKIERKFIVTGFGQGTEQDIAIINGKFTAKGNELSEGIVVEDITDDYVEISYEGKRHRLYP